MSGPQSVPPLTSPGYQRHEPVAKRRRSSYFGRSVRKTIHSLPSSETGFSCSVIALATGALSSGKAAAMASG